MILESRITSRYFTVGDQGMLCPAIWTWFVSILFLLMLKCIACVFVGFIFNFHFSNYACRMSM